MPRLNWTTTVLVCMICASLVACSSEDDGEGSGGSAGQAGSGGQAGNAGNAGSAGACFDASNPLFGSCIDDLLAGCYAPDTTGTCTDENGTVSWSDGHEYVTSGSASGLYGPGDTTPCVAVSVSGPKITATKGNQTLVYGADSASDTGTITCPDGSSFQVSFEQLTAFNRCSGINCPL